MAAALILAGGAGERLWPVSTTERAKQFVPLTGKLPLIQETFNRLKGLVDISKIYVLTTSDQLPLVSEVLSELQHENIIAEPARRNTGPSLVLGAAYIEEKIGLDEVIVVLPSDHFVSDNIKFQEDLARAFAIASLKKEIVTIGVIPDRPETEYGYISVGEEVDTDVFRGIKFEEKPSLKKAQQYVKEGGYLWNSGILVFRLEVFIEELKQYSPELYKGYLVIKDIKDSNAIQHIYKQMPKISIDYALMEKLPAFAVIPSSYEWDDLGTWRSLETIYQQDGLGNITVGSGEIMDLENCLVYSEDIPVAAIGVRNLVIAVTPKGVLICPKDQAKNIKQIVERLLKHRR